MLGKPSAPQLHSTIHALGRATRRYACSADGQLPDATRTLLLQHWKDHIRAGDELDAL